MTARQRTSNLRTSNLRTSNQRTSSPRTSSRSRLGAITGALALAAVAVLAGSPSAAAAPGPPGYPQWYFDDWDVEGLWAEGTRGQGIVIAEIDSGINADLPELEGKILPGRDFGDATKDGRFDQDLDPFGHGTAMASLMVAEPGEFRVTGLAPDARILPISVPLLGTATEGAPGYHLPDAIRWAVDNGAKIISLSLGVERVEGVDPLPCPADEQEAILYAIERGAIVVAASGNQGEEGSPVVNPGVCIGVVTVAAVDDTDAVAPFSSRHPYVTLAAPGVDLVTLGKEEDEAYIGQGTSQATAIVSAGIALVWSRHPDLTNHQVVARVLATLEQKVEGAADPARGYGLIDVGDAARADVPADAPNPLLIAITPFVERAAALEAVVAPEEPAPADTSGELDAEVVVGAAPDPITTPVQQGAALAAAGLLALLVLLVVGLVRRRRYVRWKRAAAAAEAPTPLAPPAYAPAFAGLPDEPQSSSDLGPHVLRPDDADQGRDLAR